MDDVSRLADTAEILGAAVVTNGIFFALVHMHQLRRQRRDRPAPLFRQTALATDRNRKPTNQTPGV
jgi:hypothetical protein